MKKKSKSIRVSGAVYTLVKKESDNSKWTLSDVIEAAMEVYNKKKMLEKFI